MKKTTLFLCCAFVLLSGCGNKNNQSNNVNNLEEFSESDCDDPDKIYFLDFEHNLKNITDDKLAINSFAKDIKFIPLETTEEALLYNDRVQIANINDGFLVSSSSIFTAYHSIMMFDSTGRFINYLMQRGQGPKELPYIGEWSYNHKTQLLFASTSFQIIIHSFENNISNKYTLEEYFSNACLLNDGTIVGLPGHIGNGDVNTPYIHFLNQEGVIISSLYYPQKRNIAYDIPEGRILGPSESYGLYSSNTGEALFKDMFNDTIYRIRSMNDVKPYIIIHRGSLTLTLKDINNPTGTQKIRLWNILDTKKYFIIKYEYKGKTYSSIWDKQTQSLVTIFDFTKQSFSRAGDNYATYRTPTGKVITINISGYFDGKLYGILDAADAMEFLPGIVEDDNPVLMIITM